jgi:hypothetical protein
MPPYRDAADFRALAVIRRVRARHTLLGHRQKLR